MINTGIGLMIAKALEENGAKVYIVGRRKDVLDSVAQKEAVRLDECSKTQYYPIGLILDRTQ